MQADISNPALFGASPGTGNLGVDALCWSTLSGLAERGLDDAAVFGHGAGESIEQAPGADSRPRFRLIGTQVGRRIWQRNHLSRVALEARARIPGNPVVEAVRNSAAVLDVSGGDSFTDLYGNARFKAITLPKRLALHLGRPLVLLPQTYGPFASQHKRTEARRLVASAALAYARDPDSFENLRNLLGDAFDPDRHREGVDMAFGLASYATGHTERCVAALRRPGQPLVGINVSGLLANRPDTASAQFQLGCDYVELMKQLVLHLIDSSNAQILLIPHVLRPSGHFEADQDACNALLQHVLEIRPEAKSRMSTLSNTSNACELKWVISQMDWFCGARMHSTIAALSSGVPAAAVAYSLKTRGVFARAGQAEAVVDLRSMTGRDALARLLALWDQREQHADRLAGALPHVKVAAATQMDEIASVVLRSRSPSR